MKRLFIALFVLSMFPSAILADPLPLNQYDKDNKKIKASVYSRFRPFYYPKKDSDGAFVLGEVTAYNEGTDYYIIDGHLYMTFVSFSLYIPSTKTLPRPEIIDFGGYGEKHTDFREQTLDKFRVQPVDGKTFTLSCGGNKSVRFTYKQSVYSTVTWIDDGKEYPFTLEECPIGTDYMTYRTFAYCDNNILYYDGDEDLSNIPKDKRISGIFFCDLKNRTRGAYAVKLRADHDVLWPYNPMGIPGTNWIVYTKESHDEKENAIEQLVVRAKLTQEQADKAAKEYQERLQLLQKEQAKK